VIDLARRVFDRPDAVRAVERLPVESIVLRSRGVVLVRAGLSRTATTVAVSRAVARACVDDSTTDRQVDLVAASLVLPAAAVDHDLRRRRDGHALATKYRVPQALAWSRIALVTGVPVAVVMGAALWTSGGSWPRTVRAQARGHVATRLYRPEITDDPDRAVLLAE
jgi:hypothetical protein